MPRHLPWHRLPPHETDTAVLCIHGILGSPDHFRVLAQEIPQEFAVYSIRLCGHGAGVDAFAAVSMRAWRHQVRKVLKQLEQRYAHLILVAHSMGTLFALQAAVRNPTQIAGLFLLGVPLCPHVTLRAVTEALRVLFHRTPPQDAWANAARDAYSIQPDCRLWRYLRWIPQYVGLFVEIARTRRVLACVTVPCIAVQSARDELVSMRSMRHLRRNPRIQCVVLRHSGHFYAPPADAVMRANVLREFLRSDFGSMRGFDGCGGK